MPPYRDLDKGLLVGSVLGSYKNVQQKYGDALVEEHTAKNARVAALDAEARDLSKSAAQEALRIRSEGEQQAHEVQAEAEAKVREIEEERLRRLQAHHARIQKLQEQTEGERALTDQRIHDIEEETEALFAAGEERILRIGRERDTAIRTARERCIEAERRGEERARQAEQRERELLKEAQLAAKDSERRCVLKVRETETKCEVLLDHQQQGIKNLQQQVAKRVEDLLNEGRGSRSSLLDNRARADQHLQQQLAEKREVTMKQILDRQVALEDARGRRRAANVVADTAFMEMADECRTHRGEQIIEANAMATNVHGIIGVMSWQDRTNHDRYVQALAELAEKLRGGRFLLPAPSVPRLVSHNVLPEDLSTNSTQSATAAAGTAEGC